MSDLYLCFYFGFEFDFRVGSDIGLALFSMLALVLFLVSDFVLDMDSYFDEHCLFSCNIERAV